MVTKYGMSERLGPLTFGNDQRAQFLKGAGLAEGRDYSEETARVIDEEVRAIVERSLSRVRSILGAKKATLLRGAEELKTRETLEGELLRRLLAGESKEEVS
jgi:cell division protease FtsH